MKKDRINSLMEILDEGCISPIDLRLEALDKFCDKAIVKIAFDTRRVDPTKYNPRRNLQNYHRSENFISEGAVKTIEKFFKVKEALDELEAEYSKSPDWLDSYCRVLKDTLDKTLRIDQNDFDFFKRQLDYVEELLDVRYRLKFEDLNIKSKEDIKKILLDKDSKLLHANVYSKYTGENKLLTEALVRTTGKTIGSEDMINALFGGVKATAEAKEVERTITITIKDKIGDK